MVIHAHYLPVSKPDVMFYVFVYNSVCMSFVTHLVCMVFFVCVVVQSMPSLYNNRIRVCQAGTACMCAHY